MSGGSGGRGDGSANTRADSPANGDPARRPRPTLASIAAELGVSRTSVSNAYNRPDRLSAELRERILGHAGRMGYPGPDPMARGLRMRRVGAVGVLFTEQLSFAFEDPASVDFLAGLAEECGRRGDSMLVIPASSASEGGNAADLIRQAVVDSLVVYSVAEDDPFLGAALERGVPTVICDQPTTVADVPFVGVDDREAIKPAVRHVLGLGHRRVGILSVRLSRRPNDGPVDARRLAGARHHVQRFRVEGALEALADGGVGPASVPIVERHINDPVNNYDAARELLTANPGLTAVVCTTDTQALGVLRYARDNGIRVPEDLSVTGFDGIEVARLLGVATVVQPNRRKGREAGRVLMGAAGQPDFAVQPDSTDGEGPAPRVILPTEFVPGATTARPRPPV